MNVKTDWMEILAILGSAIGGILSMLLFAITQNSFSLFLFVIGLFGGAVLGIFIEKFIYNTNK